MTSRIDASLWLGDDAPAAVTAAAIPGPEGRIILMVDDLAIHATADTLRATLVAALAALDGLQP